MSHQSAESLPLADNLTEPVIFRISPLIRITLLGLYLALTIPLPFLAAATSAPIPPIALWFGLGLGSLLLYATLAESVIADDRGIQVRYPIWVPAFWRKGWFLPWTEIEALKPRTTGQGGLVYYLRTKSGVGYLLPMRMAGFARFVRIVEAKTGISTAEVRPLSQPWMYLILLGCTLLLLAIDAWTIGVAIAIPH